MLLNYRLLIKYDGTRYNGWQRQGATDNTIQGKLEDVISKMCGTHIEITGSGRTDAGVHAIGQVANFKADTDLSVEEIKDYLNRYLPEDIAVSKVSIASERFHSRFCAKKKTYLYRIYIGNDKPVFDKRYVYVLEDMYGVLDISAMEKAAEHIIGVHDFKSFCGNKHMKKSAVREIYSIDFCEKDDELYIYFCGNGFLQNMVRIITGTLIDAGMHKIAPDAVKTILESRDRRLAGGLAPAKGLTLLEVEY